MMRFTVPGPPVGKARARVVLNRGKVRAFTPEKSASFANLMRLSFVGKYPNFVPVDEGPISVSITAYFQPPKCFRPKGKDVDPERVPHTKKPDADNIAKQIDSLNGVAWRDDSLVSDIKVSKRYSLTPRTEIEISYGGKNEKHKLPMRHMRNGKF